MKDRRSQDGIKNALMTCDFSDATAPLSPTFMDHPLPAFGLFSLVFLIIAHYQWPHPLLTHTHVNCTVAFRYVTLSTRPVRWSSRGVFRGPRSRAVRGLCVDEVLVRL